MRALLPVGLALLAAGEAVAALRNLTEDDLLVALLYLLSAAGFGAAAAAIRAAPGSAGRIGAAAALAVVAVARVGRFSTYPLGALSTWLLLVLLAGALAVVLLAGGAIGRARLPPAPASTALLTGGFSLEALGFVWLLVNVVPSFPALLTVLLAIAGGACGALGAWRGRLDRSELAAGA